MVVPGMIALSLMPAVAVIVAGTSIVLVALVKTSIVVAVIVLGVAVERLAVAETAIVVLVALVRMVAPKPIVAAVISIAIDAYAQSMRTEKYADVVSCLCGLRRTERRNRQSGGA